MTKVLIKHRLPEDVEVGKAYAFTLSPIDNLQFFNANIIHRVNQFKNGTKEVLDSYLIPLTYELNYVWSYPSNLDCIIMDGLLFLQMKI